MLFVFPIPPTGTRDHDCPSFTRSVRFTMEGHLPPDKNAQDPLNTSEKEFLKKYNDGECAASVYHVQY